jgi:hypothetical protein
MRNITILKLSVITGLLVLTGCASKIASPDKYSGFLKDYSGLKETKSATGKPVMRWIAPDFDSSRYDSIVYNPVTFYPVPAPSKQLSQDTLNNILSYTNTKLKEAAAVYKPLEKEPGSRSLIFRGAITGVDRSKEGLQFYEVIPIALVVAGTEMATGHRTMDTHLYFEGELIDSKTGKTVVKVVRLGEGKDLRNENTPVTADTIKQVIDDMAVDASMFSQQKK